MSLSIGIVGLPNVGKTTLFTALTGKLAEAASYAFSTIEPNVGVVPVPDPRLDRLPELVHPGRTTPAAIAFAGIAGRARGAEATVRARSSGLSGGIRQPWRGVSALSHVARQIERKPIRGRRFGTSIQPAKESRARGK